MFRNNYKVGNGVISRKPQPAPKPVVTVASPKPPTTVNRDADIRFELIAKGLIRDASVAPASHSETLRDKYIAAGVIKPRVSKRLRRATAA
jgi:hypothetical protein